MAEPYSGPKHLFRSQQGVPNIERFSISGLEHILRTAGFQLDADVDDPSTHRMFYDWPEHKTENWLSEADRHDWNPNQGVGDPWDWQMYSDKRVGKVTEGRYVGAIQDRIAELRPPENYGEAGWPFQTESPLQYPDRVSMALASGSRSPYQLQQMQGPARYGIGGLSRGVMGGGGQTGNIWGQMGANRASSYQGQLGSPAAQQYNRVTGLYSQSGPQYG